VPVGLAFNKDSSWRTAHLPRLRPHFAPGLGGLTPPPNPTLIPQVQPLSFRLDRGSIITARHSRLGEVSDMTGLRTEEYTLSKVSENRRDVSLWAPPQLGATQSSIARDDPTQFSVNTQAIADLNSSGALPIGQIEGTAPDAPFACDREMRIDKLDRIALSVAPDLDIHRRRIVIMIGAALICLGLGWIAASSNFFSATPTSLRVKQVNPSASPADSAKSDRLEMPDSSTSTATATGIGRAQETSNVGAKTTHLVPKKQNTSAPGSAAERTKVSTRPTPVPETRPTTIEGWTIREVNGGTAVLEGPNGIWKAARGDTVPGVGKIDSIVRWGNRWIVATSRGLISTP
jgi:hypothetical protein